MPHFRIDCRQSATHIFISILIIMDDSSAAFLYGWIHKSQTYRTIRKNISQKMTSSTDEAKSYIFGYKKWFPADILVCRDLFLPFIVHLTENFFHKFLQSFSSHLDGTLSIGGKRI
ncbi:hypothetical protein AD933_01130 [Acetobacter malorum]|uniref:Uncharacterized protein n=1 Tax=Acetobacter malorum TaxID=178901 RepID=A0A149S1H7_9PROT|nr:hypothetical protein AD933_01130 [Acetobacter malorum]